MGCQRLSRHRPYSGAAASRHWRLTLQALLEQARRPTWRLWARDAAIEKKDVLKARNYSWSPGECGRPKSWYRDVADAEKAVEVSWLQSNVMEPDQPVWVLRITARERYSDRFWSWGEPLAVAIDRAADRSEGARERANQADHY